MAVLSDDKKDYGEKKVLKLDEALTETGYGLFNIFVFFCSGGTLLCLTIETMAMMFIIPAAQCDLELSLTDKGLLSAIGFAGVVSFSMFWGFLADTRGRRKILIISMFGSFITTAISSILPSAWMLILLRYLNGVFVGGSAAVCYAYVGEFHDAVKRPRVISFMATWVAVGQMIISSFSYLILSTEWTAFTIPFLEIDYRPWRQLILAFGLPCLLFGLLVLKLPESPKYLLGAGRKEEAIDVLRIMYSWNSGKSKEDYHVVDIYWDEMALNLGTSKDSLLKTMWNQTAPLFKRPFGLKTFLVCCLHFGTFAPSAGLNMWYPELLNKLAIFANNHPIEETTICNSLAYSNSLTLATNETDVHTICIDTVYPQAFLTSFILGVIYSIIFMSIGGMINLLGAKPIMIMFLSVTTACGIGAQYIAGPLQIQILTSIFMTACACIGVVNILIVELYPTQLRAMALAISLMMGRVGAVTGSNISGPLLNKFCDYTFYVFGALHILLIIVVLLLPNHKKKVIQPIE